MNYEKIFNNFLIIKNSIEKLEQEFGREKGSVKLIPVSKTKPVEMLYEVCKLGMDLLGESYAQELKSKYSYFNDHAYNQPQWHYVGHLQRNKAKYIVPFVSVIHSVDSISLAKEISKQVEKSGRDKINILLQINTSNEESKFGFNPDKIEYLINDFIKINNINLCGFMTIASVYNSEKEDEKEFLLLKEIRDFISNKVSMKMSELSMGMSADYKTAIACGSTMVRVGSDIFGKRNYK